MATQATVVPFLFLYFILLWCFVFLFIFDDSNYCFVFLIVFFVRHCYPTFSSNRPPGLVPGRPVAQLYLLMILLSESVMFTCTDLCNSFWLSFFPFSMSSLSSHPPPSMFSPPVLRSNSLLAY